MAAAKRSILKGITRLVSEAADLIAPKESITYGGLARQVLATKLKSSLRENTKASFRHQQENHLIPGFGRIPMDSDRWGEIWLEWVSATRAKGQITRFFGARKAMIEVFVAAKKSGVIQKMPEFENPDSPRDVGRVLEDKEVLTLLWRSHRPFRFMFYVLWKTGIRPREAFKWEWSMIRWNEPGKTWIDIPARITKTDRSRSIPINPDVSEILWIRNRANKGAKFVFPKTGDPTQPQLSYAAAWKTACMRAAITDAMPYDFRRTFITRCAAEGKPQVFVAKCLDTSVKMIEKFYVKMDAKTLEDVVS